MTSHITDAELLALELSGLPQSPPMIYTHISIGQLSLALHSMGCTISGHAYLYVPQTDELIRADVVKWLADLRKQEDAPSVTERCDRTGDLFDG